MTEREIRFAIAEVAALEIDKRDAVIMKICCDKFATAIGTYRAPAGGGFLYPPGNMPSGQIERNVRGGWSVNGCCGGGCYVLDDLNFCPFCGAALPPPEQLD